MASWFGFPSGKMQMDADREKFEQQELLTQRMNNAYQQTVAQMNNALYGTPQYPTTLQSTSNGLGNYVTPPFPPGSVAGMFQQTVPGVPKEQTYFVLLPSKPQKGDTITVHYDGIKWLEDRNCPSELVSGGPLNPDHSGFSLKEIEEAQKIMADCA